MFQCLQGHLRKLFFGQIERMVERSDAKLTGVFARW